LNYQKTQEVLEKAGLKYTKSAEQLKEEKWFDNVKNPRTGDFFQWSDLKQIGIDPLDEETGKRKYPIKKVTQIIRIQTPEGREFLKSRQTWIGLDRQGNEVPKSMDDKEMWKRPVFRYEMKAVNPADRFSKMERKLAGIEREVKEYDKPFTVKNLEEIYALAPGNGKMAKKDVSLAIIRVDAGGESSGSPYSVLKYDDFKGRDFDDLYE